MRWVQLAAVLAVGVGFVVGGFAVRGQGIGGAKGLVQDKLKGAEGYNQSIEDAVNGKDNSNQPPQPQLAPDAIKAGFMTRKSRDGKDVRLYFAYKAGLNRTKPAPGLLVIQEWWGLNDDIQERTREFATKGFYAVAPDLYYGKSTADATEAAKLKDSMTDAAALTAMRTGLDLFSEEERNGVVDARRIGIVGWCMGGQQALLASLADPRIKATAIFYGPLVTDPVKLKSLQGPVLGIFGNDDKAPSPADVDKFKAALKEDGKSDVTIYQFEGVGHAFASKSAEKTGMYHADKAQDAFNKLYAWLDAKLPR